VSTTQTGINLAAIARFVVAPTIVSMIGRASSTSTNFVHDSPLQAEAAARFVLSGRSIRFKGYPETTLASCYFTWAGLGVNPALDHFAYAPLSLPLVVPGDGIVRPIAHWYEHQLVLLASHLVNLVLILRLGPPAGSNMHCWSSPPSVRYC
jgi:hypothetical protein